jgi:hypothetical protein
MTKYKWAKYKWDSPHDWLMEKAQSMTVEQLHSALEAVAYRLDGDSIQDLFQTEMDQDGFFDPETETP